MTTLSLVEISANTKMLMLVGVLVIVSTVTAASMSYRQLEDFINKWTLELEEQEAMFLEQATQVNAWDRLLVDNGDKVSEY